MKKLWMVGAVILALASQIASAQAPAGSTGQCKDGTYTTAAKEAGACRGHKGVQTWFAAGSATSTGAVSAKTQSPKNASLAPTSPAPGPTVMPAKAAAPMAASTVPQPATAVRAKNPDPTALQPPASAPSMKPAPAPERTATSSSAPRSGALQAGAAGGGPGMVWVNLPTKVYHCSGSRFYGTTKDGKYMTEAEATAMGARPDHGNPCSK